MGGEREVPGNGQEHWGLWGHPGADIGKGTSFWPVLPKVDGK